MRDPIAYTYDADTHCPDCAVARFGREPRHRCVQCGEPEGTGPLGEGLHRYGPTLHEFAPSYYPWPPEDARDSEGNPVGAIAPWDDWCNGEAEALCTLACGTCGWIIETHGPHPDPDKEA